VKNLYEVIRRPLLTEKSTQLKEQHQTLVFEVHRDATKPEIKKAFELLFERKVKRQGRYAGQRPDWKKAFVVLKPGEKPVEFFEQA